jgi:Cu/Ag efflux pump CusA
MVEEALGENFDLRTVWYRFQAVRAVVERESSFLWPDLEDSLIMIDYANRRRSDQSVFNAIHKAGIRRSRPIILTTLTTFGGSPPSSWKPLRRPTNLIPMAISLGFGIIFATSIILLLVPSLYLILEDMANKTRKLVRSGG